MSKKDQNHRGLDEASTGAKPHRVLSKGGRESGTRTEVPRDLTVQHREAWLQGWKLGDTHRAGW